MLKFHRHLSLSFKVSSFLISISITAARHLKFKLHVFLIDSSLLCQDLFDLGITHLLLIPKVFYAGFSDRNVNLHQAWVLSSLHGFCLCPFGQVAVVEFACLDILRPRVSQNLIVEHSDILVQSSALLSELFLSGFLLWCSKLTLANGTIRDCIVSFKLWTFLSQDFLLGSEDSSSVIQIVHLSLQTSIDD